MIRRKRQAVDGARLSRELRRGALNLRSVGADAQFDTPGHRVITIRKILHSSDITDMPLQTALQTTAEGVDVHDSNLDGRVGSENNRIWAQIKR